MEELFYRKHIVKLFNEGILTLVSANWFHKLGYAIMVNDGKVVDIVKENENAD